MGSHADAMVAPTLRALGANEPGAWHRREVPIGGAYADVAIIRDGLLYAVELKSAADSLARLPGQLRGYERVADRIVVACAPKHVGGVRRVIQETGVGGVGILAIEGEEAAWFEHPTQNPGRVACHVAWSMHARELVSVLDTRGPVAARGVRGKNLAHVVHRCEQLGVTIDEYRAGLVRCWPVRDWERWKREREEARTRRAA